ncbi:MAG: PQQ-dependent dehydrogenase, methanol/ethanol family [Gammaproteobacteria bacterium]|nr:MAG: PQQ-dependent dehydrogenase, methanol/ethanol family [Gammaproteobacteria bacterium]
MRSTRGLLALSLCAGFGFASLGANSASAPADTPAEIQLDPLPTHWIAERPVGRGAGPVTRAMLEEPFAEDSRWLHYGGTYKNFRHSPLEQLSPANVSKLQVAWAFGTGTVGQFEVSPILYDGVLFITSSYNRLFALDAKTGAVLWRYDHQNDPNLPLCCGPANRGVAITGDLVLMATLDAHLIAFDRRTGEIAWDTEITDYTKGFTATSAPLVVDDLAYIGIAGGEYGVRGFIDAYETKTGKRVFRHYTVPAAGEPGVETWSGTSYETGGAPAWTTGTYDRELDTLFWTTGNPSPDWNGDDRLGDNLYSDSLLALDPKTGEQKWYFQFTPHDVWDYDGNSHIFLVDTTVDGTPRKLIAQANRNGFFYLIDRSDGSFVKGKPYLEQLNWATLDANGRPVVNPRAMPTDEPTERTCPSNLGGTNGAYTGSFDPALGLVFVSTIESCQAFAKGISVFVEGIPYLGGLPELVDAAAGKSYGNFVAIDASTGDVRWRARERYPMMAGALSTRGGVVFSGTLDGEAVAYESKTGKVLWRFRMGGGVRSQPIAYELDGRTYVVYGSGSFATLDDFAGGPQNIPEGGHLFVFVLPEG